MRSSLRWPVLAGALSLAAVAAGSLLHAEESTVRSSRFFLVDVKAKKVTGPAAPIQGTLRLDLVSVTVDQPQYWPQETVHLKVIMPAAVGAEFIATVTKRDAAGKDLNGKLDDNGVAVLDVLDGSKQKLEVGEYRLDVHTKDNKVQGSTTFAVVEGTLGALSLAHEFKQVTSTDELDKVKGGWFMGNASGSGKRWGNGLSFKNELRVANKPYNGDITYQSRCMLPGCNGVDAGPAQKATVKDGLVFGTMDVGGHSGPFQIEFITPKGSLRHQFEGSSHVERDMVQVSGGVSFQHRAGLAPYENTVQVPGRQIFLEKTKGAEDAFLVEDIVAKDGKITIRLNQAVSQPALHVWSPQVDGSFKVAPRTLDKELKKGASIEVPVGMPYAFVAVGGFVDGKFREGWVMAFPPSGLQLSVNAPTAGGPGKTVSVELLARSLDGQGVPVSGILEVFDNRVVSRSPVSPLASSIGDSVRNASAAISYWEDRTGIDEREEARKRAKMESEMDMKMAEEAAPSSPAMMAPSPPPAAMPSRAGGMPSPKPSAKMSAGVARMAPGGAARPGATASPEEQEEPTEPIREGEKKVVFCAVVHTGADGKANVEVTLPPQLGRVTLRFVAIKGLDHAVIQGQTDVTKKVSVEASVPRFIVPGAKLRLPVDVVNTGSEPLTLEVAGPGVEKTSRSIPPGSSDVDVNWTANPGTLSFSVLDAKGRPLDRREFSVQSLGAQQVTFSRLEMAGAAGVKVSAGENVTVYGHPGLLLRGTVMNMVTTMESWFGHAEALSARAAARAVLLAAISRGILASEGLDQTLQAGLDKSVRDLNEAFFDPAESLIRPYPGLPGNPLWSAWVSRNLHAVVRVLSADPKLAQSHATTLATAADLAKRLDEGLKKRGASTEELGGYNAQGQDVIPVEVDGQVLYKVVTDDAVSRWAVDKLVPKLGENKNHELDYSKAYDTFRFLRAFQRVGMLQYMTEIAMALFSSGQKDAFASLYGRIARGMILAQEPGMVQGPAMLGGVYSTPMAMVRFLELMLLVSDTKGTTGPVTVQTGSQSRTVALGTSVVVTKDSVVKAPAGAMLRMDRAGTVNMLAAAEKPFATVNVSKRSLAMSEESVLTVELDPARDPLEYAAVIAVPTTTFIKQTEDILSDYRGELIYGQQATGSSKMQLVAVPFRGSRTLRLLLEGGLPGSAPGAVAVRHIENIGDVSAVPVPEITVK